MFLHIYETYKDSLKRIRFEVNLQNVNFSTTLATTGFPNVHISAKNYMLTSQLFYL